MAKVKVTRQELEELAEDMNSVMGLDPEIKVTKKMTDDDLIKRIKKEAKEIAEDEDFEQLADKDELEEDKEFFSDESIETMKKIGIELPEGLDGENVEEEEEEKPKAKGKGKKAEKEEEPEEEEEEEEEEKPKVKGKKAAEKEKSKAAAKGKGKKEEAEEEEEEEEKPKAKAKAKGKAAAKKKDGPKFTRDMGVHAAIKELCKKGATFKQIMDRSDEIFVEHGGKSVPDAVNVNKYCLKGLVEFGVLELKDEKYKFA